MGKKVIFLILSVLFLATVFFLYFRPRFFGSSLSPISPLAPSLVIKADPGWPAPVLEAIKKANPSVKLGSYSNKEGVKIVLSSQPTSLEWVLVPVAPFPTLKDEVSWSEIKAFWQKGEDILPPLFCSPEVKSFLSLVLGAPHHKAHLEVVPADQIIDQVWKRRPSWAIIPFDQLEPRWKVWRLDGVNVLEKGLSQKQYPLRFYFSFAGEGAERLSLPHFTNRDEEKMTVLIMTGVTALVRATAVRMEEKGVLYPAEKIAPLLRSADITHISNEIPFAQNCPPPRMNQKELVFCSDPRYIRLLEEVGTDVVELTGNHFEDYGPEATRQTVAMYNQQGWLHYGGGVDLSDSLQPARIERNGNSFAFLGCNSFGPAYAWAKEGYPGAAPCRRDYFYQTLDRLQKEVDIPIFTWQYEESYQYEPLEKQKEDFRAMVDAGAKIVSGSQSHQPQAIEFYHDGFIHYGLGNLFFDQMWSLGTRQECVDRHVIYQGRHIATELLTFMLEDYAQPRPMTKEERQRLLQSLFLASGW